MNPHKNIPLPSIFPPSIPQQSTGLQRQPQPAGIFALDEDWTGITDPKKRRKLQNRLSQRSLRVKKKIAEDRTRGIAQNVSKSEANAFGGQRYISILPKQENQIIKSTCSKQAVQNALTMLREFEYVAYESYSAGTPCLGHLLSLSKFNVIRAFAANLEMIGVSVQSLNQDTPSPFCACPPFRDLSQGSMSVHYSPTMTQCSIPHHPWLDCFPFPQVRDNVINAQQSFDVCKLAVVIMEPANVNLSLLVWGEPWDPWNWEVSEWFLQNWGWVIRGCPEILRSSNYWRSKRGLKPLAT